MKALTQHMKRGCNLLLPPGLIASLGLMAALPSQADTAYTSTGWVKAVPVMPIICTNAAGQVLWRGNAHIAAVQSTNDLLTGNRVIFANGAYQADGTALVWGTAYQQVGTFDGSTNFTPTAGVWEITFSGVMQADNSLELELSGYGSGGAIEGMRIVETLTRKPALGPIDLAVPYLYTGALKPAPLNTSVLADDFDDGVPTGWIRSGTGTHFPPYETNTHFTVSGHWPGLVTRAHADTYSWDLLRKNWSVTNHQTLEWRVDLVGMTETATNAAAIVPAHNAASRCYLFYKGRDFLSLAKWVGPGMAVFFHDPQVVKNSNVVLSLALTRVDANLVLTARVLDKDNQEAVIYERRFVDTPQADLTLTSAQLRALSGMALDVVPDTAPPLMAGDSILLDCWQYTDGAQPRADVTYDNLVMRTTEIPLVAIERAARLSFPDLGATTYSPQWGPTPQGPWQPIPDQTIPGMIQITVPANDRMKFIRLIQTP